jgi:hypothetical protein
VSVAPTIIWVLCPAGAKAGALRLSRRATFASSIRSLMPAMAARVRSRFFSGASSASEATVGSSMLMLIRSAQRPASSIKAGDASGIVFK